MRHTDLGAYLDNAGSSTPLEKKEEAVVVPATPTATSEPASSSRGPTTMVVDPPATSAEATATATLTARSVFNDAQVKVRDQGFDEIRNNMTNMKTELQQAFTDALDAKMQTILAAVSGEKPTKQPRPSPPPGPGPSA